jgi:hypothetical protein
MSQNISAYVEQVIEYEKIIAELNEASHFKEPKPKVESTKKKITPVVYNLCTKHPKYGAKRRPQSDCESCWNAFEKYNGKDATVRARRDYERKTGNTLGLNGKDTKSVRR